MLDLFGYLFDPNEKKNEEDEVDEVAMALSLYEQHLEDNE